MNFIKKHKKFVIITTIIFAVLLTVIILIFTLFSLKSVTLNFKTSTDVLSGEEVQQDIISQVYENGGSTVLFSNKNHIKNKLEKNFPYLKIVNIETIFPSSFVVHCIEREELYAIEDGGKVYYLDEDMKILKIAEGNFTKTESNAVLLNIADLNLNIEDAEEGQFLNIGSEGDSVPAVLANYSQNILTSLLTAFESNNRNIAVVRAGYQSFAIKLGYIGGGNTTTWYICLSVVDNLGFETEIIEANDRLNEKISAMLSKVSELASDDPNRLLTDKLTIYENASGQILYILSAK